MASLTFKKEKRFRLHGFLTSIFAQTYIFDSCLYYYRYTKQACSICLSCHYEQQVLCASPQIRNSPHPNPVFIFTVNTPYPPTNDNGVIELRFKLLDATRIQLFWSIRDMQQVTGSVLLENVILAFILHETMPNQKFASII